MTTAAASAARVAAVRCRLADLGLSPDEDEVETLTAMEGMFNASLQALRALDTGGTSGPGDDDPVVYSRDQGIGNRESGSGFFVLEAEFAVQADETGER